MVGIVALAPVRPALGQVSRPCLPTVNGSRGSLRLGGGLRLGLLGSGTAFGFGLLALQLARVGLLSTSTARRFASAAGGLDGPGLGALPMVWRMRLAV
jgi:hypothetical protein